MYIKREDAMEVIYKLDLCLTNSEYFAHDDLMRAIPSADVAEVVRCKDCKHAIIVDDVFPEDEVTCSLLSQDVACNNYCMYGEKGEQWYIGKVEDLYEVREKMDKEE